MSWWILNFSRLTLTDVVWSQIFAWIWWLLMDTEKHQFLFSQHTHYVKWPPYFWYCQQILLSLNLNHYLKKAYGVVTFPFIYCYYPLFSFILKFNNRFPGEVSFFTGSFLPGDNSEDKSNASLLFSCPFTTVSLVHF